MEHEGNSDTNDNWCTWSNPQKIRKWNRRLRNQKTNKDLLDKSNIKIGKNSEKCPGDLRRLVVTQNNKKTIKKYTLEKQENPSKKLCRRNLIKRINTWGVILEDIGPFIKCSRRKLTEMNQIKKLISIHKGLHRRDDNDYVSRKEGGRRLATIENCVDAKSWGLEESTRKSKEILITVASNSFSSIMSKKNNKTKKTKMGTCSYVNHGTWLWP